MPVAEHDIAVLVDEIWMTTLGLPTRQVDTVDGRLMPAGPTLDGIINITGEWQGAVTLQVPKRLAARVASAMFRLDSATPTLEDMQDAVGELTNMTGGNIKGLLPGTCHLSLPTVIEGADYRLRLPGAEVVRQVAFRCEDEPIVVQLIAVRAD